ncbi:DUF3618 domain-containing protein [Ectothiorhodospiraceae bacterium 2226]|nr:DUF3618 domain-containing protein [Ectothiorhodospiraceae bacterium 2226]
MKSNGNGRSAAEIEAEISHTRAEMHETLDAIQRKLSPGQVLDEALHYLRDGPGDYFTQLGESVKRNPLPVAMLGLSMGWLALASRADQGGYTGAGVTRSWGKASGGTGEKMGDMGERAGELGTRMGEQVGELGERAQQAGEDLRHTLEDVGQRGRRGLHQARDQATRWREEMRGQGMRARQGIEHLFQEQPLLLGLLGVAAGAALGAALPASRQEDELMGDAADQWRERAKAFGEEQVEKVQNVVEEAGAAGADEARRELGADSGSPPTQAH